MRRRAERGRHPSARSHTVMQWQVNGRELQRCYRTEEEEEEEEEVGGKGRAEEKWDGDEMIG